MNNWFVGCFATDDDYAVEMENMALSLKRHFPDVPCITCIVPRRGRTWLDMTRYKAHWITKTALCYREKYGSMLWLDADSRVRRTFDAPACQGIGGKRYMLGRVSTGTLWVHESVPKDFLQEWAAYPYQSNQTEEHALHELLAAHPEVPYCELSDDMTAPCSILQRGYSGSLWRDAAIVHWNRSRKTLGIVKDWPPAEDERP